MCKDKSEAEWGVEGEGRRGRKRVAD
jgi:hypothetical protein